MVDNYSTYIGNRGALGGVYLIRELTGQVFIQYSTFSQNTATLGGAIQIQAGSMQITNCTFNRNRAAEGGAISSFGIGQFVVTNSSFIEN